MMLVPLETLTRSLYDLALASAARELTPSESELKMMLDACNGLHLLEGLLGQHLRAEVQDAIALNQTDKKWEIDGKALVRRIRGLTQIQTAAVEIWIAEFWGSALLNDADFERAHFARMGLGTAAAER